MKPHFVRLIPLQKKTAGFRRWMFVAITLALAIGGRPAPAAPPPATKPAALADDVRAEVDRDLASLAAKLASLRTAAGNDSAKLDLLADAEVFHKAADWALRYDAVFTPNDLALLKKSIARGHQRADSLLANQHPWTTKTGRVLHGYLSSIDHSTQPFGILLPSTYDPAKPTRLDVVLHGSSKPSGKSELQFLSRFDEGDAPAARPAPAVNYIELHPLGRVENCYRWAGETDVFEAIDAACRAYHIDRDRIVLRGMSMGASGTWHLGLKHPSAFVALGPYCGYVDTHRFSVTPKMGFPAIGELPPIQESALHINDAVDYAVNTSVVPEIAAIGDKDPFFNNAHVIMAEALAKEGLPFVNLISPGTGHTIDPVTFKEQMRRIAEYADKGLDHAPRKLRFVTWTLKYNVCHWIELLGLQQHYQRSEIIATVAEDGSIDVSEVKNITRFAIHPPMLQNPAAKVRIAGAEIVLPKSTGASHRTLVFSFDGHAWTCSGPRESVTLTGKRPGVQGPIDDAFTSPFLCIRGTGVPWNPAVNDWADASLRRFAYEFARYMRGDVQIKNDADVTADDIRTKHLILFGDPGSNSLLAAALPKLPLTWTKTDLQMNGRHYPSKDHAPAFICASPLPGAGDHYLVLNTGHTFHEKDYITVNFLLFPRLGDWSVMQLGPGSAAWQPGRTPFPETSVDAGYFDEHWQPGSAANAAK